VCVRVCAQVVREIPVEIVKEIPVYIKVDPTEWDSRHNLRSFNMTSAYPTGMYVMRMYIYIASQHERERERERKRERERERERSTPRAICRSATRGVPVGPHTSGVVSHVYDAYVHIYNSTRYCTYM